MPLDLARLQDLFRPLHDEAVALAPEVLARSAPSENPIAYLVRDAYRDPERSPPIGWPTDWKNLWHLPEPFIGNALGRPSIAFVGTNPSIDHQEPCPRHGTSLTDWLNFWLAGFGPAGEPHWARNPVPLYEAYRRVLREAIGPSARLGREAIVTEIIRYKAWKPGSQRQQFRAANHATSLPLTEAFLHELGVTTVVTVGGSSTRLLGGSLVPALRVAKMRDVHGTLHRSRSGVFVIPSYHLSSARELNGREDRERRVLDLGRVVSTSLNT